jgi:hypothetical protein
MGGVRGVECILHSFYAIMNYRGVKPVYIPAILGGGGVTHLLFECVVARTIWDYVRKFMGIDICSDYVSIASKWLQKEKCYVTNFVSIAALRGIWLMRNDFIFNNQV